MPNKCKALIQVTEKTLMDLEFATVLRSVEEFCVSDLGRTSVKAIQPFERNLELKTELAQVNEYLSSFENDNRIPGHYFEDITKELHLLTIEDSFLEADSFMQIASMADLIKLLLGFYKKFKEIYPVLFQESEHLPLLDAMVQRIHQVVNQHGEVQDGASETLKSIRKQIGSIRSKLGSSFTKALSQYASSGYLDEIRESVVDNQRVLAVQAMYRKKVKGAILGSSKTGSIVFIAPESTLQFHRDLQNTQYEEQEEIVKILKELTNSIRPYKEDLAIYQSYLTHLDLIGAKAKYARDINACLPKIVREKKIRLIDAYHPILWEENKAKGIPVIPQTLELNESQQIIVISGPNAGGKSITLKTIGLLQLMVQSGLLIPVHERSEISLFDKILTDIGDNQSIENQLSTYSYRLKNMRNFLRRCNERTLFLIDEFGTGSDPELGGAMAEVFLETFHEKGAYGIITTHYANLKVLANELPNVKNANMAFDQRSLEPLFKLHIGEAGSSFTFEVAQKIGIPFKLINRAKKKVEREKLRLDKTIAKLQQDRTELRKKTSLLEKEKLQAQKNSEAVEIQKNKIQKKLESFQQLYDHNQKMLSYGRKANELFNRFFQNGNKKQLREGFIKWAMIELSTHNKLKKDKEEIEKNKKNAERERPLSKRERTRINKELRLEEERKARELKRIEEKLVPELDQLREVIEKEEREKALVIDGYQIKVNDIVRLKDGNAKGTVEKIEKKTVTINYGLFTAKSSIDQIELVKKG